MIAVLTVVSQDDGSLLCKYGPTCVQDMKNRKRWMYDGRYMVMYYFVAMLEDISVHAQNQKKQCR